MPSLSFYSMTLKSTDIEPFYQVIVFVADGNPIKEMLECLDRGMQELAQKSGHLINYKVITDTKDLKIRQYTHKYFPTWLKNAPALSPGETAKELENKDNAIFILYKSKKYIFMHVSSEYIERHAFDYIRKETKSYRPIDLAKLYAFTRGNGLDFRTLGLTNVYNAGGTAPEAKTFYGRNTEYSLSVSSDAGYSFNYGLGSRKRAGKKNPFGVSTKKRKIWGSWTKGVKDFQTLCKALVKELDKTVKSKKFEVLCTPIEVETTKKLKLFHCYIDYVDPKKGMRLLKFPGTSEYTLDWNCALDEEHNDQIVINHENSGNSVQINLKRTDSLGWEFSYSSTSKTLQYLVAEEGASLAGRRGTDFLNLLNKQEDFTLLFEKGIAYRNEVYWKDNRFTQPFLLSELLIDWAKTNIQKESSNSAIAGESISETVVTYLKSLKGTNKPIFIIDDDGANEVSDLVVITAVKKILIHLKFSASSAPGLRINDLQVVCSQALKNLRFFNPILISSRIDRLKNKVKFPLAIPPTIAVDLESHFGNIHARNECWIVQPGISKKKLEKDKSNKAHMLLNYLHGICLSNNIDFKFICSP